MDTSVLEKVGHLFSRDCCHTLPFDWEHFCFICGEKCNPKHKSRWSIVQSSSRQDELSAHKMFSNLLAFAENRKDSILIKRLKSVPNENLAAVGARYHRKKCYVAYVWSQEENKENVERKERKQDALKTLAKEMKRKIVDDEEIWTTSKMKSRYVQISDDLDIDSDELDKAPHMIKRNLLNAQEASELTFVHRHGQTDLVVSNKMTFTEAVNKVHDLDNDFKNETETQELSFSQMSSRYEHDSEEVILHKAAGILRQRLLIKKVNQHTHKEYFASDEISSEAMLDFVDPLLLKTLGWIVSGELHSQALTCHSRQLLTLACDITSLTTSVSSPKHLGLAVFLHHEFGSRKLVEHISALGYCIPYHELRSFLTSASLYLSSLQNHSDVGSFIPPNIKKKEDGGKLVVGVADNWDHNENTPDGKGTTHAMTSILVTQKVGSVSGIPRFPRKLAQTLDISTIRGGNLSAVIRYERPDAKPRPPKLDPAPTSTELFDISDCPGVKEAETKELLYNILRSGEILETDEDVVPPWNAFHCATSPNKNPVESTVSFTPILMAPPNNHDTIFTTLLRIKEAANQLGHTAVPVCFDLGILGKALEIVWSNPEKLEGVILMEGGMHLLLSVFSAVGAMYGEAGLGHLFRESGMFAPGTTKKILAGKEFDKGMYGVKVVDEVLHRRLLHQFHVWCDERGKSLPETCTEKLQTLYSLLSEDRGQTSDGDVASAFTKAQEIMQQEFMPLFDEFREEGREASPTFRFWDDFLAKVLVPIKLFIAATRNADWAVYLAAKVKLIPLLFCTNRMNYARYVPVLALMMRRLPSEITRAFNEGSFVAQLSKGRFKRVWMDYTLETTENKTLKGHGGIVGLTLRGNALARWFLSRPATAVYASKFSELAKEKSNLASDSRLSKAKSARWNKNVQNMTNLFTGTFYDPFSLSNPPGSLINICTGAVASQDVQNSLLGALDKGSKMANDFIDERLIQNPDGSTHKNFNEPISRYPLKAMSETKKPQRSKGFFVSGELMYRRLLAFNAMKKVPLKRVMAFENSTVPLSIFNDDGSAHSCTKSHFMHKLEEVVPFTAAAKNSYGEAIVFDGNAVIHSLPAPCGQETCTFKDMASRFLQHVIRVADSLSKCCKQIHIVFDCYRHQSRKHALREKRSGKSPGHEYHVRLDVQIPKSWNLFLLNERNRAKLADCYKNYLEIHGGACLSDEQELYLSGGEGSNALLISNHSTMNFRPLSSNHEEGDTMLVLHAAVAADSGCNTILVSSPDTDVLVLLLHHRESIKAAELFFVTKRSGTPMFLPIHELYTAIPAREMRIMLTVYCLTGCDTVSSFFGHGKKKAFKVMQQRADELQEMSGVGASNVVTSAEKAACVKFVGALYGYPESKTLNDLRCKMAGKQVAPKKLPPTDDSFSLHLDRAIIQLIVWRQAICLEQDIPESTNFGYVVTDDNKLYPKMMQQSPAAPELMNELVCDCQLGTCDTYCSCFLNGQPCTDACRCRALLSEDEFSVQEICTNVLTRLALVEDSDETSEEDDE